MCRSQSINYHKSTTIERITSHERLSQIIQTRPINHHPWPTDSIDQRPTRGISQDVDISPLCSVHERLPNISMNHKLPTLHNLSHLILSSTMDIHLSTIYPRPNIITHVPITVKTKTIRPRPKPVRDEPMPTKIKRHQSPPALLVTIDKIPRHTLTTFNWKIQRVHRQQIIHHQGWKQSLPRCPVQPYKLTRVIPVQQRNRREHPS